MSARPGAALSRLVYGTFLKEIPDTGHVYSIKIRDYGNVRVEVTWAKVSKEDIIKRKFRMRSKKKVRKKDRSEMSEDDLKRSIRRSRATIRRSIMGSKADHMLTLTYRKNIEDESQAWSDWNKFKQKVRYKLGKFEYLVVPEKQKRGSIHFHAAVIGRQDVNLLRKIWKSVVGEGNIDVQYRGRTRKGEWSKENLAQYLCKYLSKGIDGNNEIHSHRYKKFLKTDTKEMTVYLPPCLDGSNYFMNQLMVQLTGDLPKSKWESEADGKYGWMASW